MLISHLVPAFFRAAHACGPGDLLSIQFLCRGLAGQLAQPVVGLAAAALPLRRRLPAEVLRRIKDYVVDQPDAKLTVSSLAALANLSPHHFARLFKSTTGRTVHEFVLDQRLQMSYDLLVATDLPIGRIATDVGFADESHFVRRFKAVFGLTPGALRKRSS